MATTVHNCLNCQPTSNKCCCCKHEHATTSTEGVAFFTFILYLQYLGLLVLQGVDFGLWGELLATLNVLTAMFSLDPLIEQEPLVQTLFFSGVSAIFILLFFAQTFSSWLENAEHTIEFKLLRIEAKILAISFLLLFFALVAVLLLHFLKVRSDLFLVIWPLGVLLLLVLLYWAIARGVLEWCRGDVTLLRAIIFVPLINLVGECSVTHGRFLNGTLQEDESYSFSEITLTGGTFYVLFIFFSMIECFTLICCRRTSRQAFVNLLLLLEKGAIGTFANSAKIDIATEDLTEQGVLDQQNTLLLRFIATLGCSLVLFSIFRPFASAEENQLIIYPRLSQVVLFSFKLLKQDLTDLLSQFILLSMFSVPMLTFFALKISPRQSFLDFRARLKGSRQVIHSFSDEIDRVEAWGRGWHKVYGTQNMLEKVASLREQNRYNKHDWNLKDCENKLMTIEFTSSFRGEPFEEETFNLAYFHPTVIECGFNSLTNIKELQFAATKETDILQVLSHKNCSRLPYLTSVTIAITEEYLSGFGDILCILEMLNEQPQITSLTIIFWELTSSYGNTNFTRELSMNQTLEELYIFHSGDTGNLGVNTKDVILNLPTSLKKLHLETGPGHLHEAYIPPLLMLSSIHLPQLKASWNVALELIEAAECCEISTLCIDVPEEDLNLLNNAIAYSMLHSKTEFHSALQRSGPFELADLPDMKKVMQSVRKSDLMNDIENASANFILDRHGKLSSFTDKVWEYLEDGVCCYIIAILAKLTPEEKNQVQSFIGEPVARNKRRTTIGDTVKEKGLFYTDHCLEFLASFGVDI